VGVGESLERCRPVFQEHREVRLVHAGHPTPAAVRRLEPPVVLVFGAREARMRWRRTLVTGGFREESDFVFIA
jgi:hypothetical protein